jgi:hypothetical protein
MNIKLRDLTLAGWLLTLVTIGIIVLLMIYSGSLWQDILPPGRYPASLLAAPGLIIGLAFFGVCSALLRAIGIPVVRSARPAEQMDQAAFDLLPQDVQALGHPLVVFPVPLSTKVAQLAGLVFLEAFGIGVIGLVCWGAVAAVATGEFLWLPVAVSAIVFLVWFLVWLARRTLRILRKHVVVGPRGLALLEGSTPLIIPWQAIARASYESESGTESLTLSYDDGKTLEITDWLKNVHELARIVEDNLARAKPAAADS